MRQLRDLCEAHRRRHALQRVSVAEDVVDDTDLLHVLFETQKTFVQGLQMLMRLIQEHIHILVIH